ncbi:hypothetical protein ACFOYW_04820 [Gryllotalpicola reticulitermitis]|uniref:Uncharacterized protein n=1 Tax=Gryllotalpicola reticulitermitis TaxID=1184153 RepID=A0ABV8Q4W8_9MICO
MEHTTRSSTMSPSAGSGTALGLSHILTSLLPATVHTTGGPQRYTVNAVFTRRPSAGETQGLNGAEARAWLDRAGFPTVTTKVSDRRLEIANTSLEELQAGLGSVLASLLQQLSAADLERTNALTASLAGIDKDEAQRWDAVRARATAIRFPVAPRQPGAALDGEPLALTGVVASLLPATVGTYSGPERYTVTAEFTRAPTHTERALMADPLSWERRDASGYPTRALSVRDRLLEIHDTSLEELEDGLAEVVAHTLAEIGDTARAEDAERTAHAAELAAAERERARYVADTAAAITFDAVADVAPAAR